MKNTDSLVEIATRHQVFLERLKTKQANDFVKVLGDLDKAITEVLAPLSGRVDSLGKRQLNKVLKDLREAQSALLLRNEITFLEELKEISGYEAEFEARALTHSIEEAFPKKKIKVPAVEAAFRVAVDTPLSATGELLKPFIRKWSNNQVLGVDNAVRRAWSEGRTVPQLMQEIRGAKAAKFKDGILQGTSRRQAEAVARTAVQHVASRSRMATWQRNPDVVQKYKFVATLDSRTTVRCRSLDGRTFEVGRGPNPPIHINCRSTTVAVPEKKFEILEEGQTRASKDGYVPAGQTYYQWLKKQPKAFQIDVLGPTRARLFREGGLSADKFARMNLDRNFNPLNLEEMKLKEPSVFARADVDL